MIKNIYFYKVLLLILFKAIGHKSQILVTVCGYRHAHALCTLFERFDTYTYKKIVSQIILHAISK